MIQIKFTFVRTKRSRSWSLNFVIFFAEKTQAVCKWKWNGSKTRIWNFKKVNRRIHAICLFDQFIPVLSVLVPFTAFHSIIIHCDQPNPQHWNAKISVIGCYCRGDEIHLFYNTNKINKILRKCDDFCNICKCNDVWKSVRFIVISFKHTNTTHSRTHAHANILNEFIDTEYDFILSADKCWTAFCNDLSQKYQRVVDGKWLIHSFVHHLNLQWRPFHSEIHIYFRIYLDE